MDRAETAKRFYAQARMMTIAMAFSVVAYGVVGYYLIQMGKSGPAILNAQTYPLAKYGALVVSVIGIFMMQQLSRRAFDAVPASLPSTERPVQRLLVRTILMSAGAELPLLLGMLLVFLGRQPHDFIPFAVVALTGFWLAFPRKQQWVEWLGVDF
ncbi:MAG: hypothetical protein V1882_02610 [Candidatus Omnitrophota bacterium]